MARHLGVPPSPHEERDFEDGEHKIRPLVSVRGQDVYVVQSLHAGPKASANDKIIKLLFFLNGLRENGASRITALVPYLAYSRKDRQTKTRDPVTTKYVAQLLEASGADCVVTLDVHNVVAFQNAFRCRSIHLDSRCLFARYVRDHFAASKLTVISPDPGGVKRAQLFREMLEGILGRSVGQGFIEKRRSAGQVTGELLAGDVEGTSVLVVDDLIASGGTMVRAAKTAIAHGANDVYAFAAHGLFTGDAMQTLSSGSLSRVVVTDTVPPFRLTTDFASLRTVVVSAAPLFADCVRCLRGEGSIASLLGDEE